MSESSWTLAEVAEMAQGRLTEPSLAGRRFPFSMISLDSRSLAPGQFFVALRGERFDAHDHLPEAREKLACGALVDHPAAAPGFPQVAVGDSLLGWQRWGRAHRERLPDLPILGLTGSSGKTTSKDLIAHLLGGLGEVRATEGNRNNHVGVPWTLLSLRDSDRYGVIEMGMNHPGEIERLSRLVSPTAALITDIGTAHVGYLGSREAILAAKMEILRGMPAGSPLVLPHDRWVLDRLPAGAREHPITTFGLSEEADWHPRGRIRWSFTGTSLEVEGLGRIQISLLGPGAVLSALAALATVSALGADARALAARLSSAAPRPLRMEPRSIQGVRWLLDCYNASPESTRMAIQFLREVPHQGRRILVLGELGELGEHSAAIHQDLGRRVGAIETVLFVGEEARHAHRANRETALASSTSIALGDALEAAEWLRVRLRPGDLVMLKGSRKSALERILAALYPAGADASSPGQERR